MIDSVRALWTRYIRRGQADARANAAIRRQPARHRVLLPVCDELAIWLWCIPGLSHEADPIDRPKDTAIDELFVRIERD